MSAQSEKADPATYASLRLRIAVDRALQFYSEEEVRKIVESELNARRK